MKMKTFTSVIALIIIPFLYFLIWTGFEKEKVICSVRAEALKNNGIDFSKIIYENRNIENYPDPVRELIKELNNSRSEDTGGSRILLSLSRANRFEFEVEEAQNDFYFMHRKASVEYDGGRTVIHACPDVLRCPEESAMPRILCEGVFDNAGKRGITAGDFPGEGKSWYIKPVMKIKKNDFSYFDERPVAAIYIKNSNGKTDTCIIRVRNFAGKRSGEYSGEYLDKYTFSALTDSLRVSFPGNNTGGKVDFQIYWFGQVEVWFDKLTVDDEMGNQLINGENMISSSMDGHIKSETTKESFFKLINTLKKDKNIKASNYPCINYVLNRMYEELYPVQYAGAR